MARSYKPKDTKANGNTPREWTQLVPHKYCGRTELGRPGKSNKVQRCQDCQVIKAQQASVANKGGKSRRQDKISWGLEMEAFD
jgi:hypothetical protein